MKEYEDIYQTLFEQLRTEFQDPNDKIYKDVFVTNYKPYYKQFSKSFGYVNYFPLIFGYVNDTETL